MPSWRPSNSGRTTSGLANRELAKAEGRLADRERVRGRREADSGQRWKDVERLTAQAPAAAVTEPTPTGPA